MRIVPPPPTDPFMDERGFLTLPWRRFFTAVANRIGKPEYLELGSGKDRVVFNLADLKIVLTGPDTITGFTPYAGAAQAATYSQAAAQATDDAARDTADKLEELMVILRSRGVIDL